MHVRNFVLLALAAAAIAFLFGGCSAVPPEFVAAERAVYDAIADDYLAYVEDDTRLSAARKHDKTELVLTWFARIAEAEDALKR